jgi:membrane-bound inhibitor of C-type lysozyme
MARKNLFASSTKSWLFFSAMAITLFFAPAVLAQQPDPNPIPPPAQPAPTSPAAPTAPVPSAGSPAGSSPSSHLMRTWRRLTYTCDADAKVVVNVHAKQVRLVFKGKTYNLQQVEEAEGLKYTGDSLVWRLKDDVGVLEKVSKTDEKSSDDKSLAAGCHLQSAGTNPSTPPTKTPPASH